MAYSLAKAPNAVRKPRAQSSQPIRWLGRRETMRAPNQPNSRSTSCSSSSPVVKARSEYWGRRRFMTSAATESKPDSTNSDQPSRAAVRLLTASPPPRRVPSLRHNRRRPSRDRYEWVQQGNPPAVAPLAALANDARVTRHGTRSPAELGAVAARSEHRRSCRPCHPRATSSGQQRYPADNHGHSKGARGLGARL